MKRGIHPWFFAVALVACVGIGIFAAVAAELRFTIGESLNHTLSVCLKKEDAIEILTVQSKDGFDKAKEAWNSKEECAPLPVIGPQVGQVVFTVKVDMNGPKEGKVVEIVNEGKVVGYFLTSAPVEVKRDNDA